METKLIPFKFNFTNNVIQRIFEMDQNENCVNVNEELLTPEVTIEKIKAPKKEEYPIETEEIDFMDSEEDACSMMPDFLSHFLLDDGVTNFSTDFENVETVLDRSKDLLFECSFCNHFTFRREALNLHIKQAHNSYKPYTCPLCSYCSNQRKMLRRHFLAVHERHKPHKCLECDYSASLNSNLKKHIENVHRKNKPHKCSECSYMTSEKGKLRRHFDSVHRNSRPYNCPYCSYSANREATLKSHMWTVHSDSNLSVLNASSTYDAKNDLKRRIAAYINELKYLECTHCEFSFSSQRQLTRHLELAHSVKHKITLECGDCKKFYRDKRSLKTHILSVHLQERPYQCQLCSYNTVDTRYLSKHVYNVHMKSRK